MEQSAGRRRQSGYLFNRLNRTDLMVGSRNGHKSHVGSEQVRKMVEIDAPIRPKANSIYLEA